MLSEDCCLEPLLKTFQLFFASLYCFDGLKLQFLVRLFNHEKVYEFKTLLVVAGQDHDRYHKCYENNQKNSI